MIDDPDSGTPRARMLTAQEFAERFDLVPGDDNPPAAGASGGRRLGAQIGENNVGRLFYTGGWPSTGSDEAPATYDAFVKAARAEAGQLMTAAWQGRSTKRDRDISVGSE